MNNPVIEILLTIKRGGRPSKNQMGEAVVKKETIVTKLSKDFTEFHGSEEARPKTIPARVWNRMNRIERIKFHTKKFVRDLYGYECEFSAKILEE